MKLLPAVGGPVVVAPGPAVLQSTSPARQLADMPREELDNLADEFGLDPTKYKSRQHLVAAIHDRRQMVAALDREAMMDVVRWGRRPVLSNASKEEIAKEIARIGTMRFHGLTQRGLVVLARMRGLNVGDNDPIPDLVRKLKKQEGLFEKLNRKRRAWIGGMIANLLGEDEPAGGYQYLPPAGGSGPAPSAGPTTSTASQTPPRSSTIKDDIEESGLFGGITNRIKKSADQYLNQKLDEIEARLDRKLDEIDRRLAEWRDKEIANRIRIMKITLWASVIVAAVSLIYSYVKVYVVR
ncbi:MAG TPA: hypothetical protein VK324_18180 [Tepidisphaeraceae bacterium]|nr:hypothetical protein [Tepidisphaeraceae bacterium]